MSRQKSQDTQLASLLEGITRRAVEAVNKRQWDPLADPWIHFAPGDIYDFKWGSGLILTTVQQQAFDKRTPTLPPTGHNFVDFERAIAHVAPDFHVRIIDVTTTMVDEGKDFATVMLEEEEIGVPPGVVRACMMTLGFEKQGGLWLCTSLRSVVGFDSSSRNHAR